MSGLMKGLIKKATKKAVKKATAAAGSGGKKPPRNGKKRGSTTGGALFNQQGVSKKGKSRVGEDADVLAKDSPTRRRAEKLEKRSMVSDPQYPKMEEVGSRGEKVNEGGQRTLNAVRKRRKINEKSVKDARTAQETNALGKTPKKSPRIPRTEMKHGGKITKKANGGRMSRVGLSPAEESRAGVMSEAARRRAMPRGTRIAYRAGGGVVGGSKIMHGYKKGGQV